MFELKACDERLSTGATVKELQLVGDRLRGLDARFELLEMWGEFLENHLISPFL